MSFAELLQEIREASEPSLWSEAVTLTRKKAISSTVSIDDEIRCQVLPPENRVAFEVTLFPNELDWNCSCDSHQDPCVHVAAAAMFLRQREKMGDAVVDEAPSGHIAYEFLSREEGIFFQRFAVAGERRCPIKVPLDSYLATVPDGIRLFPTAVDRDAEQKLGRYRQGVLPQETLRDLLDALAESDHVRLDRSPIRVSGNAVGIAVLVRDEGPAIALKGMQDPQIVKAFANGVALCKDGLRPIRLPKLSTDLHRIVRDGATYAARDFDRLNSEVLPRLRDEVRLIVESERVRVADRMQPRLRVNVQRQNEGATFCADVIYGDPVQAIVDQTGFHVVGSHTPERLTAEEAKLGDEWSRITGRALHTAFSLSAEEASRLASTLQMKRVSTAGEGFQATRLLEPLTLDVETTQGQVRFAVKSRDKTHKEIGVQALLDAHRQGSKWLRVEGGWAELPTDWLQRYGGLVADILHRQGQTKLGFADRFALCEALQEMDCKVPPELKATADSFRSYAKDAPLTLPEGFQGSLRAYQTEGVRWLNWLRSMECGALLADDMGLGKTIQTIANLKAPALVIVPKTLLHNWQRELALFRPQLTVNLYHGTERALDDSDVTLTTYGVGRLDADTFSGREWQQIVIDEAQIIKNPRSKIRTEIARISAHQRIALSGTPIENSLLDLWSLMDFVNPGFLGSRSWFQEYYMRGGELHSAERRAMLQRTIRPFYLRRTKGEVAKELPPRTDLIMEVTLGETERDLYQAMFAATQAEVLARFEQESGVMDILEALLRLRQICCHPQLIGKPLEGDSAKVTALCNKIEELSQEGHKVLVFSQWTSMLDLIETAVARIAVPQFRIDGGVSDRQGVIDRFQGVDGAAVMLLSLKAGGVGINLTAADHVFIVDPWWNPAAEDQATDRAHRIGQDKPVFVHRLVAENTIEEQIIALQNRKRQLAAEVLDGLGELSVSRQDLLDLFTPRTQNQL